MYSADERDRVVALNGVPQSALGAPLPVVVGDERRLVFAYYLEEPPPPVPPGGQASSVLVQRVAVVSAEGCYAHAFGPPGDDAFHGHPLASRGLHPYGAFEVLESSWVRALERMHAAVHLRHEPEHFAELRHFVFAFRHTTLEFVARGYAVELEPGPISVESLARRVAP